MTGKNRKKWLTKSDIISIIFVSVLIITFSMKLGTHREYVSHFYHPSIPFLLHMTETDYIFATETITGLIAGEDLDTEELFYVLSSSRERSMLIQQCGSFDCEIYGDFSYEDNRTHSLYHYLNNAANKVESNKFAARYYLWRAKICWNRNICASPRTLKYKIP
ncbi:MAG: hypothetical protein ACK2T7_14735 [Anaerolineales bacterium]